MYFLVEILLGIVIIGVLFLVARLKTLSNERDTLERNAESLRVKISESQSESVDLKTQLDKAQATHDLKEAELCKNITGLSEVLSAEQESIKKREADLHTKEAELTKTLAQVEQNLEEETESRKKVLSQKKSSEVRLGHIAEKLAPFLDEFDFDPENCIFLGQPIDYISFDDEIITVIEIKTGKSQLSAKQRHIRDLIEAKQIAWKEIRIK